jgi:hypothetical protein
MEAGMETELTLKMDQVIIDSAKRYAESNHKSLSKVVEDFFRKLTYENEQSQKYPPLIEELSGVISGDDVKKLAMEDEKARYILREER